MAAIPPPLGLYIHLPWCERKCPYCDFNSHESTSIPEQVYVDQLLRDLESEIQQLGERTVSTLFIGGGTPSLFSVGAIDRLMRGVAERVPLDRDLEATMEANPGSAEAGKFAGFRAAGINRLSIGVQSFHDTQLQALGRIHNAEAAVAAVTAARSAGFDSFNIDLMHGLPGQDTALAADDLRQAMATGAPHISWYQLTLEPNTLFHKRPPQLPGENLLGDIQDRGEALLDGAGYRQYEVSAYARPGFQCRHNRNYWEFGDYLGIGAGAHGKVTTDEGRILRYAKTRQPAYYLALDGYRRTGKRTLAPEELPGEFAMNALRLNDGFALDLYQSRTGQSLNTLTPLIDALVQRGLLEDETARVKATALGRRFLDSVIGEFLSG